MNDGTSSIAAGTLEGIELLKPYGYDSAFHSGRFHIRLYKGTAKVASVDDTDWLTAVKKAVALAENINVPSEKTMKIKKEGTRIPAREWTGPVYAEGFGYNDGYFADIGALDDYCADEEIALPEEVYGCKERKFQLPSALDLIHNEAEHDHWEDIVSHLTDHKELDEAIQKWNARQTAATWYPDYTKIISLEDTPPNA